MKGPAPALPGVRIVGTGIQVPERVLDNHALSRLVDTHDDWITLRTGIRQRHIVAEDQSVRDLALGAARAALADAGLQASDLDMVLVATMTPESSCPSTAARVAAELGAVPAGAMDIAVACSGFVYGLNHAAALIHAGMCRTVAVIGAETMSRVIDFEDRRTCILFGDAASCAILQRDASTPEAGVIGQSMHADGRAWKELHLPHRPEHLPTGEFSGKLGTLQMNGQEVFKFAVSTLQKAIEDILATHQISPEQLAAIIPHQSNRRILDLIRTRLGLPHDKIVINIDRYGNTSAASVGLALHEMRHGLHGMPRLQAGDLVLFAAIGGGMCWGTSLWRL